MVSLVLVSHSKALAAATLTLVRAMAGDEVTIAVAAGAGEDGNDLGTDAMAIFEAINGAMSDDGVMVLMDMGSAVLSAEMAMDFLDEDSRSKVHLCSSPFIEGAVAAGVAAKIGSPIDDVIREAESSLNQKIEHINPKAITAAPSLAAATDMSGADSVVVKIRMPNGLHARPAAKLVQEAAQYKSEIQIRDVTNGKGPVSIKSITGIIALEALRGHEVELQAKGEDQMRVLAELKGAIYAGLGDPVDDLAVDIPATANKEQDTETGKVIGVCKGIVIAPVYRPAISEVELPEDRADNTEAESARLQDALTATITQLKQRAAEVARTIGKSDGEIFLAQATMLEDPQLIDNASKQIRENMFQAPKAWWIAVGKVIDTYRSLDNDNLRQRALDLQDVAHLVLSQLGVAVNNTINIPAKGIIMVDDITPGQVAALDKETVLGVICMENGQTSHSSILLRSRGIPSIVQARNFVHSLKDIPDATVIAIDGETGDIRINPQGEELAMIEKRRAEWLEQSEAERRESMEDAQTADGVRIEVFANVGSADDSMAAVENGAEGIGLLRTEFLFLHRDSAPSEQEQMDQLNAILEPMGKRPVIIRTLDAGGDKELPYLNMPAEANPFLGVRAIRLTLRRPELFNTQLRAILRVADKYDVRIMFPMISKADELHKAKESLAKAHESLAAEGTAHRWPVLTGMMMEVPSAAVMADDFAREVDFMSIGTNDLVQYTMAVDRGNPALQQSLTDGFDPAVTALISRIGKACSRHNVPLAVCGESASDKALAATLIGLGVTELSMNPGSIPEIKYWLRRQYHKELVQRAEELLSRR